MKMKAGAYVSADSIAEESQHQADIRKGARSLYVVEFSILGSRQSTIDFTQF